MSGWLHESHYLSMTIAPFLEKRTALVAEAFIQEIQSILREENDRIYYEKVEP